MTEVELREKALRVEDALNATKCAIEEGIIPGGGLAYLRAVNEINKNCESSTDNDYEAGRDLVFTSVQSPLRQIVKNAGEIVEDVVSEIISKECKVGFNAATGEFEDLVASGIIDPVKVTRNALKTAVSIASTILTAETVVAEEPEDDDKKTEDIINNTVM